MFVFDTSAFINGWRVHYPPGTYPFDLVWERFDEAMRDGRIIAPRMVLVELREKDDDVGRWANDRKDLFAYPNEAVQREVGPIEQMFSSKPGVRDKADPFVIAEAQVRTFTVVTYEGTNTLTGLPTKKADEKMPGICRRLGIPCCIVPEALARLGAPS